MKIFDFLDLFIEKEVQKISIFDLNSGSTIFDGFAEDIQDKIEIGNNEVISIDNLYEPTDTITINIEL